jgi:S-adenosylmethionine hydrolase
MSPVVTLLTDFGYQDSYVAEMKGALLRRVPGVLLVDISHAVAPGDVAGGQYVLARTWRQFPAGTIHLAVVDPGVGSARRALAVSHGEHFFVGPDNGLLTPVLDDAVTVELPVPADAAPTFHGRDLFAPAAAALAGGDPVTSLGREMHDPVRLPVSLPRADGEFTVGRVVHVDRFGTLITDIPRSALGSASVVVVGGEAPVPLGLTFADVASGELVAFVGSGGTLEIAARDRSAAQAIGVGVGSEVRFRSA